MMLCHAVAGVFFLRGKDDIVAWRSKHSLSHVEKIRLQRHDKEGHAVYACFQRTLSGHRLRAVLKTSAFIRPASTPGADLGDREGRLCRTDVRRRSITI